MLPLNLLSLPLLCLLPSLASASPIVARVPSSFSLYAYGTGIGGLRVFYADGLAYIGKTLPENASVSTNITFSPESSDSTVWTITPTTDGISFNDTKALYINPSSGAYDAVGFTSSPTSTEETTGFIFYGAYVLWESSSGDLESLFFATPTSQDNLWEIKWNSDFVDDGSSVAVALRDVAPSTS